MKSWWKKLLVFPVIFALLTLQVCSGDGDGDLSAGSEGGPCYGNGTCNPGLTCNSSNICVQEDSDLCEGVTCSGHGTCAVMGGSAICVCDDGYHDEGLACVENDPDNPCEGVTCSGHGTCAVSSGSAICICDENYHADGLACVEDTSPCEDGPCNARCLAEGHDGGGYCDSGTCRCVDTTDGDADTDVDTDVDSDGDTDTDADHSCPDDMVLIEELGNVCIDRYEASEGAGGAAQSVAGVIPWANMLLDGAAAACEAAGKRLCEADEWLAACQGSAGHVYPYGDTYEAHTCNGERHGVLERVPTGSMEGCEGGYPGIFDMSGNVAEWTAAACAGGGCLVRGGCWGCNRVPEADRCDFTNTYTATETNAGLGFRCCLTL